MAIQVCKHLMVDKSIPEGYRCSDYRPCEHIVKNEINCPIMHIMRDYVAGKRKVYNPVKQKMLDEIAAAAKPKQVDLNENKCKRV
jgi:hypothetical protein